MTSRREADAVADRYRGTYGENWEFEIRVREEVTK
jgi:hypothetical protein